MVLYYLDVLSVVVPVCLLNGIEDIEAVLELLIELDVVDGMRHFFDFLLQLVLLTSSDVVVVVAALGQSYLEIYLCLLELLLVGVHSGRKVSEKGNNVA